jgi:hypothetical protein
MEIIFFISLSYLPVVDMFCLHTHVDMCVMCQPPKFTKGNFSVLPPP